MGQHLMNRPPKFVHGFTDRHGKARFYFRRAGFKRTALPGLPWSPEFMAAYGAASAGESPHAEIGASRTKLGTINALVVAYFTSAQFRTLAPATQSNRRNILQKFRVAHGEKRFALLQRPHIQKMVTEKLDTPFAARVLLKTLRGLMQFAVAERFLSEDPTQGVANVKATSNGHKTWSEDHIAAYEAHHPVGSKARLAMALMLYTGCRIGDVVALGRQHIKDGWLTYTQEKNGQSRFRKPVILAIPVHPELRRVIDATPNDHLTFLVTAYGKPHSKKAFGSKVREWCDQAGCPDVSSHGLRKAIARRMAEATKSTQEIMAVTGHRTLSEVERYTKDASQKKLAATGMDFTTPSMDGSRTQIGKPR